MTMLTAICYIALGVLGTLGINMIEAEYHEECKKNGMYD